MPTISGLRRRGYTPESIKNFSDAIGVTKRDAIVDVAKLENSLREDLNNEIKDLKKKYLHHSTNH